MAFFQTSQLGATVLGESQALGETQHEINPDTPAVFEGKRRTTLGWNQKNSRRRFTRGEIFTQPIKREESAFATIVITSVSGALIGRIRTDIQKSLLRTLEFTDDENGSADFIMTLNKFPEFEILPFSMLEITVGTSDFSWYKGILSYPDNQGTDRDFLEFKGFGLRRYLEEWKADVDFGPGLDITEIVDNIVQVHVAPRGPIVYNASKIGPLSGVLIANKVEFGKFPIRNVLDTLVKMAQTDDFYYQWGVDGDGDFFWERKATDSLERTWHIGFNLNNFKPRTNFERVRNAIIVQRKEGRGSGGAGWAVAGLFNDASSAAKYGENELNVQIPGFFATAEANLFGNALLDSLKEPIDSARLKFWQANRAVDYLTRGNYRAIMPLKDFQENIDDIDDASDFSIIGSGDLAAADDTTFFVFGTGSTRLTFTASAGTRAELNIVAKGFIKEIRFYIRSSATGAFMTVGVGTSVWDQVTTKLDIPIAESFLPIIWDVSNENLRDITKFAIEIDDDFGFERNVWIDKLDILFSGHKTYRMRLKRTTYRFTPQSSGAESELGELPDALPDYVSGLQALSEELRFTGEAW